MQELTARISPVLRRYGVVSAAVFGSVARGEAGPGSDVDLLVELPEDATLLTLSGLQIELTRTLGREVDVVTERGLKKLIRPQVMAEQVRVYG
ncbi:MAG: nucleotidyltransferase family protein [Desulfovibrionaceae bacterium]|nr:nucleotidyltransferase family protein [Desulfovibrionaceae bacterium]MBF0512994.1 nucleotidyltransferase family protein [Desulfovibrionaceae bacterium]